MSQIMSKILDCYRYSSDTNLLVLDFLPRWVISSVSCNAVPLRTGHNGNLLDDICISISHYLLDSSSTIPITWNFIDCKSFYLWNSYVYFPAITFVSTSIYRPNLRSNHCFYRKQWPCNISIMQQ